MAWKIRLEISAEKSLAKFDHQLRKQIRNYLRKEIAILDNPRLKGKALTGNKRGLWRYRVGKYRIVCRINDRILTVIVLTVAKRDVIYDD